MNIQSGITAYQMEETSYYKWFQKSADWGNIKSHKTNHSLRATGATELYEAEVPEKIIQKRTGYRSLECLRMYERSSEKKKQVVSNILNY